MAIKGKKRSKSGRKPRAAAPKREVVEATTPLVSKRWFQITLACVLTVLVGFGLGFGFGNQAAEDAVTNAGGERAESIEQLDAAITSSLEATGTFSPNAFEPFPDFPAALEGGDAKTGAEVSKNAKAAAKELSTVQLVAVAPGLSEEELTEATDTVGLLIQGLGLFEQAGDRLARSGGDRSAIAEARDVAASADAVTRLAYQQIVHWKVEAGLAEPLVDTQQLADQALQEAGFPAGDPAVMPPLPTDTDPAAP